MKYKTVQEKITAIDKWQTDQHAKLKSLAESATNPIQKAMLAGKAKAYLDGACFINGKYGKYLIKD